MNIDRAADTLLQARRNHSVLTDLGEDAPPGPTAAYDIADALAARIGLPVAGWKVGATNAKVMQAIGLAEPFLGRIFAPEVLRSPARFAAGRYPNTLLEAEYVVTLGADLPARGRPYVRAEIDAAVAKVHVGLEITQPHFKDVLKTPGHSVMADNGSNVGVVLGPEIADWRSRDLAAIPVALKVNGETRTEGSGANVLGHPFESIVWLANQRIARGDHLRAGQLVSTGSCAMFVWVFGGDRAVAAFGGVGEAVLDLD